MRGRTASHLDQLPKEIPRALPVAAVGVEYLSLKRGLDVVLTLIGLVVLAPIYVLTAIAIKADSRGRVLFEQERVGSRLKITGDGTVWEPYVFRMFKFRSMVEDADSSLHEAFVAACVAGEIGGPTEPDHKYKLDRDPRITRVGSFIRRTSIDELPQLLNVLRGDMSLVGPRPVPIYEAARYQPRHCWRLASKPGVTGTWQVSGRGRVSFEEMIQLDLDYVRTRGLIQDLRLLLLTVPTVISGRGAG